MPQLRQVLLVRGEPLEQQNDNLGSNAERLLRAQAAELQALRERVADLPDPDTMAAWRASHERLTEMQASLPQWRERLQAAHQQEQQRLQQTVEQQQQALADAQLRSELQTAFLQSGGNPAFFDAWRELGAKNITRADDGALMINGQPLNDALTQQRMDQMLGMFYHPRYGAGSGAKPGKDGRVSNTANLHKMKTGELFRAAFGGSK